FSISTFGSSSCIRFFLFSIFSRPPGPGGRDGVLWLLCDCIHRALARKRKYRSPQGEYRMCPAHISLALKRKYRFSGDMFACGKRDIAAIYAAAI
ncbi:MAG: hypothetical protein IIZ25_10165, partial [Thermoguttaceae bacterium]|nr:hypothetical protein [Thermoguttaceae bacterium]